MPLTRVDNWPVLLSRYEAAERQRPFVWGSRDCVLVGLRCAEVMLGIMCTGAIEGKYSTALGAAKQMRKLFKAKDLDEAATAFAAAWGGEEIAPLMAQRGDLVLADVVAPDGSVGPSIGFVGVNGRAGQFAAPVGLTAVQLPLCRRAWRVG